MEINYFDIVVTIVILFLGLKGILNGFFKEFFGLIGIVGGIFIASRLASDVGIFLNELIFNFDNDSAINFTGFLTTLALFWLLMIAIGQIFKKLTSLSGLGGFDQILGFIFGASKFFFIAAVIAHASYNIKAVKSLIDDSALKTSYLFPILTQAGAIIMKLDTVEIQESINKTTNNASSDMSNDILEKIKKSMPQVAKDLLNKSDS